MEGYQLQARTMESMSICKRTNLRGVLLFVRIFLIKIPAVEVCVNIIYLTNSKFKLHLDAFRYISVLVHYWSDTANILSSFFSTGFSEETYR